MNNVMIGSVTLKEGDHLTPTNKKIIQKLVDSNLMQGGTKLIQFVLEKVGSNEYSYKKYERYAKASREFDTRPESKIVKWHYEGKGVVKVK
ncbi:MAG: hypothetical protein EBU84_20160 [Actinobacteria bacterium]|nr:hypothetical protein [Actinomycetota bacterium]